MKSIKITFMILLFVQFPLSNASESIWRGLIEGQSPQEVAEIIRQMDGVKKVKVKKAKKKRPASLKIKYVKKGSIEVAGKKVTINPLFNSGKLFAVELNIAPDGWTSCLSKALVVQEELDLLLTQGYSQESKYGSEVISEYDTRISQRKIRIIGKSTSDYEKLPERLKSLTNVYKNDSLTVENIVRVNALTHSAGTTGSGIANIMYNLCKSEAGYYGYNTLRYSSNRYQEDLRLQKAEKANVAVEGLRDRASEL